MKSLQFVTIVITAFLAVWLQGCQPSKVVRKDSVNSEAAATTSRDQEVESSNPEETIALEPVPIGGGFLRADCGPFTVFSSREELHACGLFEGGKKHQNATITGIDLQSAAGLISVPFIMLGPAEAWHIAFTMPSGLTRASIQGVKVNFKLDGVDYQTSSTSVLSGKADVPTRLETTADFPTPVALSYPLAQMSRSWVASFDNDPSLLDRNGDGQADWLVTRGSITGESFVNGLFRTAGVVLLKSSPFVVAPRKVSLDFAMAHLTETTDPAAMGAEFWFNVDYGNGSFGQVFCMLKRDGLGGQTLRLYTKTADNPRVLLHQLTGLPLGMVRFALLLDTAPRSALLKVNGTEYGPFTYSTLNIVDTGASALDGRASDVAFSYVLMGLEE
ncbi:MAG TPA: hypothetical protein VE954_26960 [Oligoflexus sp.]|uniref:hypothetical protein n=1 Tax=Oligoflexus sp. TaxID=1971216 RepID=UPI002D3BC439|nr:hypothetical protein [Oligoflexus sp.]HYX36765.1 hypothetical protein [Oligoflexus sp.]